MVSATESELGGLFENCQKATATRTALAETGRQQPPKTAAKDNIASNSIVNVTAKQKISRAIDIIFYWVRDIIQILGGGQEKSSGFCHKTPPNLAPY